MGRQIVITEKTSQARDIRAAVGGRYGSILPAEGHLLELEEPEQVEPGWKRWSPVLLRPPGLYGTRPASGGNKAAKLKAILAALRGADRVWLATDCDREGQLIGQEILEHGRFRGEVRRVMFTAQDPQTIRDAFERARPNAEYAPLYQAAVARRQADQIYNLSLTRTATVTLARGARTVIGVGRVKTPTLAIVCRREREILRFVPQAYFEVVATAVAAGGRFAMRHAPAERITERAQAEAIATLADNDRGPLAVSVEEKRQAPPRLHDLPSLQKLCASRFGWSAARTLEIAQALYDGAGKKIITYPRAETRFLPESLIPDVGAIVSGLQAGRTFAAIPVPDPPLVRRGRNGTFSDHGLAGAAHHAVIPNRNRMEALGEIWPRLDADEKRLFDVIARAYLAAVMPDFRYRQTVARRMVGGHLFRAVGRQPIVAGWRAAFPEWQPAEERGEDAQLLPPLVDNEPVTLGSPRVENKETRAPPRYNEGTLIDAMQNSWRFVVDPALQARLKDAKGIGTPATRAEIIRGLRTQELLATDGKSIVPTARGLMLFDVLGAADPALVDPGATARLEQLLDQVLVGETAMMGAIDAVCAQAERIIGRLASRTGAPLVLPAAAAPVRADAPPGTRAFRNKAPRTGTPQAGPKAGTSRAGTARARTPQARPAADKTNATRTRPARAGTKTGAGTDTALRIPFGNKEAAQQLGARYRDGGWFAPPGIALDPFRKRGWL